MSKSVFIETLERGVTAHQAGRLNDALKSYQAALEIRPNEPTSAVSAGPAGSSVARATRPWLGA